MPEKELRRLDKIKEILIAQGTNLIIATVFNEIMDRISLYFPLFAFNFLNINYY